MRTYKYLFFSVLLALAGCHSEETVPDNVISEKRMPVIIAEMHIIDGDLYNVPQMPDSLYKYSMGHFTALFKKHHTDTLQFRKSYTWYTKHPVKLDKIYDEVIKILQAKNDSIAKLPASKAPANTVKPAQPTNAVPTK